MRVKQVTIILAIILLFITFIFLIVDKHHQQRINKLIDNKYETNSKNIQNHVQQLISQKKQQGLTLALSLAKNQNYIDFFQKQTTAPDLKNLASDLKQHTDQHNVWIHFVSNQGISLYRSWAKKKGDNVAKIRKELPPLLQNPKPTNLISVGIFDLSFKSIVPVYQDKKFLGLVEVITKVNSITKNLKTLGYESVVLVNKTYKNQIKKPFTKTFVDDYYVANLNADKKHLEIIKSVDINNLNKKQHIVLNNEQLTSYIIQDIFNNDLAYFIVFEKIKNIDLQEIENIDQFIKIVGIILLLLGIAILISLYYYNKSRYTNRLEKTVERRTKEITALKDYHSILFDKNPNIVFVAAIDFGIIEANSSFFEFFDKYTSLEEFNSTNDCLCKYAIKKDDPKYIDPDGDWREQITQEHKKVCIKKDNQLHHFRLESEILEHSTYTEVFLITLTDITELILAQEDLDEKQRLMFEQSKLADMGEMIGNIAHQWRQPLSVISTASTSVLLYRDMGKLTDTILDNELNHINDNAQYLSQTIDDFQNFIKGDRNDNIFNLKDTMDSFTNLIQGSVKNHDIKLVTTIDDSVEFFGNQNELTQCLINIFNNAKDILKEVDYDRYIFIDIQKHHKEIIISIKDNAGGVPLNIINNIFEPYFTTKHKSRGTGLGLSMTYNLIKDSMKGSISVKNETYTYNDIQYKGANFIIQLPSK